MKGKSEKPTVTLMPATTVHGKRKRPKFGSSLGRSRATVAFPTQ
jgi:hypothetical protein